MRSIPILALSIVACQATTPDSKDFGSFLPADSKVTTDAGKVDIDEGENLCFTGTDEDSTDLSIAGQLFEMSWENLWPGEYIPNVGIKIVDWCGTEVTQFDVGDLGSFAVHLNVGEHGFNGYFEYPYRPENIDEAEWEMGEYPLYREFDKEFRGDYIHCNLRLFGPDIIEVPLNLLKQQDDKGYVQGTIYEIIEYETLAGVTVEASSGTVTYVSNASFPDQTLTESQDKGLFLVANTDLGPVELTITLPSGNKVSKTVLAWPLTSEPNLVITNVGFPVHPELL